MKKLLTVCLVMLTGCAPSIDTYKDNSPKLDLRQYVNGDMEAWGVIENWRGEVTRHFYIDMQASWNGDKGQLNEQIRYSDGENDTRTWNITHIDSQHFTGTAGDVIGTAKGTIAGNAAHIKYVMEIPQGDKTYNMSVDDWWFLTDDKRLINKIYLKKFGFTFATLTIAFKKK